MELIKIKSDDLDKVFMLSKQLLNYDSFLTYENKNFVNTLSNYTSSILLSKATDGYFVIENNKTIGMIVYSVPNRPFLFNQEILNVHKDELKHYLKTNKLNPIESQIVRYEFDTIRNSVAMYHKYKQLILGKAEIILLFIKKSHRGRGISKSLMNLFYEDIGKSFLKHFYLYTTSMLNFKFYEHLQMNRINSTIYKQGYCPSYIATKINLPYVGMLFFGNKK